MAQNAVRQQYSLYFQRVNLIYKRPEIRASLEIIMSVFAVTFLIMFAIRPTVTNIFELQKRIEDQEVLEKKADTKIAALLSAEKQLSENSDKLELFNLAVPDTFDYYNVAKRLTLTATDDGVTLQRMLFPGGLMVGDKSLTGIKKEKTDEFMTAETSGLIVTKVSFSVAGNQENLFSFLGDIENMDRVALIKKISIEKIQKSAETSRPGLSAEVEVNFYSLKLTP